MKTADAPELATEDIKRFLAGQRPPLALRDSHFSGYITDGMTETWSVIVYKIGDPKEAKLRYIERSTSEGFPIRWAKGDLPD